MNDKKPVQITKSILQTTATLLTGRFASRRTAVTVFPMDVGKTTSVYGNQAFVRKQT
ncbi:hypothetical protein [Negadavirga shengliensis]|uniref:Uncharacterized protein n=1 Tax=Negadavirga shengliensis TaxID=1389218 RepID=A0ABV9T6M3_9BACT